MIVHMGNKTYEMTAKQFKGFRDTAKQCLPVGIYAVAKDGVAIMMNEKPKDSEDLKRQIEDLKGKGFKVWWNGF